MMSSLSDTSFGAGIRLRFARPSRDGCAKRKRRSDSRGDPPQRLVASEDREQIEHAGPDHDARRRDADRMVEVAELQPASLAERLRRRLESRDVPRLQRLYLGGVVAERLRHPRLLDAFLDEGRIEHRIAEEVRILE